MWWNGREEKKKEKKDEGNEKRIWEQRASNTYKHTRKEQKKGGEKQKILFSLSLRS